MSGKGASGDLIKSPVQKKMPVPQNQSTPVNPKKMTETSESQDAAHGLAGLNSRFSHIIERNNQMTDENAKLQAENETLRESKKAEVDKVKQFYEVEIAEARRLLDAEAEKVVQANMEAQGLRDDLKEKDEKLRTLTISERENRKIAEDLQAEMDQLRADAATNRRKFQNFQEEKDSMTMQLSSAKSDADKLKKAADSANLKYKNALNSHQSQQEDLQMKIRILEGQLESAKEEQSLALQKSLMQKSTFEATMSEAIENIREDHQEELLKREETIKNQFKKRMSDLEGKAKRANEMAETRRDEAAKQKALADKAKKMHESLEKENKKMRNRINDLEADVVSQKSMADDKMKEMAEEAKEWQEKYESSEQLIKTGTDKYNSLKKEVETYRSLLEVEETRLNITPSPVRSRKRNRISTTTSNSPKKQRTSAENSPDSSNLEVSEVGVVEEGSEPRDGNASCSIQ